MLKYLFFALLGLILTAKAQPFLTPEPTFLGIPGLSCLSTRWFQQHSEKMLLIR